jgi:hypothetical protein
MVICLCPATRGRVDSGHGCKFGCNAESSVSESWGCMKADCRQAAKNTVRGGAMSMVELDTWHTRKLELRHRSTRSEMATRPAGFLTKIRGSRRKYAVVVRQISQGVRNWRKQNVNKILNRIRRYYSL